MLLNDSSEISIDALSLIFWNEKEQKYVYERSGRVVSDPILKKHIEERLKPIKNRADDYVTQLINKEISFEDWQRRTAELVKKSHNEMMRFGRGGRDRTFAIHYLDVANELRSQYKFLRENLATDIHNGTQSESQIRNRVGRYIDASAVSYERGRASYWEGRGVVSYTRGLGNCKEHCNPCIYYASLGRLPISDIVYPGQHCDCIDNCCCSISPSTEPPTRGAGAKLRAYIAGR